MDEWILADWREMSINFPKGNFQEVVWCLELFAFTYSLRYNVSQMETNLERSAAMATTKMVHVRVDEQLKIHATETLAAMGLSVSDAVRVFLMRVVAENRIPFELKAPNAETRAAIAEADEIARKRNIRFTTATELFDDIEKNSSK
jgi:DNA-damage-inducible protein J